MIEVTIPKDVMEYKAAFIGPFTLRQSACFLTACVVEFTYYQVLHALHATLSMNTALGIGVLLAVPIFLFTLEPYGMKMEQFLLNVFILNLLAPRVRPYETKNFFDEQVKQEGQVKKRKFSSRELKQNPDFIMYL